MGQCLAASGDSVHVVRWDSKNNGSGIFYQISYDSGSTWGTEKRISSSPGISDFPSIAVSGSFVHIAYRVTAKGIITSRYRHSTDGGNTWEQDISLGNYYWWPSVTVSGSKVFVALNSNETYNSEVWLRRSLNDGLDWDSVVRISNALNRSEDPTVAAASENVHLPWNDNRTGKMEIFYRRSTDNGIKWEAEKQITNGGIKLHTPQCYLLKMRE